MIKQGHMIQRYDMYLLLICENSLLVLNFASCLNTLQYNDSTNTILGEEFCTTISA